MARQIRALPIAPSSTRPATFNAEADAFVAALSGFVSDANALAAEAEQNSSNLTTAVNNASASANAAKISETNAKASEQVATEAAQGANQSKESAAQSATSALSSAQTATGVESRLQQALGTLEQVEQIIQNGIIDDTEPKALKAFSSKKVDDDYVPKNKDVSDPRLYGKKLTTDSEANSVVLRDDEGYILNTMPAGSTFSNSHTLCARGSDNKEKFVNLQDVYSKGLKSLIELDFAGKALDLFDEFYEGRFTYPQGTNVFALKNGDLFLYDEQPHTSGNDTRYKILSSNFIEKPFAKPINGHQPHCVRVQNDIYLCHLAAGRIYKLIDNNGSYQWQEILSYPGGQTYVGLSGFRQFCCKFLYGCYNNKFYKFNGSSWSQVSGFPNEAGGTNFDNIIYKDQHFNANANSGKAFVYKGDSDIFISNFPSTGIFDISSWSDYSGSDKALLTSMLSASYDTVVFPEKFSIKKQGNQLEITNYATQKKYLVPLSANAFQANGIFKKDGYFYIIGGFPQGSQTKYGISRISKAFLKYYGVE